MRVQIIYPWVALWPGSTAVDNMSGSNALEVVLSAQRQHQNPQIRIVTLHVIPLQQILTIHYRRWCLRQYNFDLQISRWSFGFWYFLLDIHYCSLVSQIGAVLFLHGIILRRWLGRSLKTLSSSSDFPYFYFE